jgi:hypothetical protein
MRRALALVVAIGLLPLSRSAELPEYQIKAAFLYNFAQFTEWPRTVGRELNVCTFGVDPFGTDLESLRDKPVGQRNVRLSRHVAGADVGACHVLYVSRESVAALPTLQQHLAGKPVLIVTDSPGGTGLGATVNMTVTQGRVTFEANRKTARACGLELSYRLLRLATEVIQ